MLGNSDADPGHTLSVDATLLTTATILTDRDFGALRWPGSREVNNSPFVSRTARPRTARPRTYLRWPVLQGEEKLSLVANQGAAVELVTGLG